MSDNRGLPSRQYGVGDDRLDSGPGHDLIQRQRVCPEGMGARLSRLLHVSVRSASHWWRTAACALAAALALSLGGGASAAEGTLPTVSVSDAEAYEDGTRISFEVSLSQPSGERLTVEVATSSGTATSGADFRAVSRTVIFPAHSREPQLVLVKLRDDQTREPDETFTVTLTNPVGATLGDATATGTIRNDDTVATLTASGIGETSATLKIGGYTDGWWYEGGDYSTGIGYNGQAWRIYRRNVHPCTAVAAGTTAVSIGGLTSAMPYDYRAYSDSACSTRLAKVRFQTLAPEGTPTVSVSDAEVSEDGAWMDFTVSLSQGSRERVTVRVHTSSGTATSGADFRAVSRTLTFPANDRTPLSVRVFVHDDEELEPDEVFAVTLTNPVGATLGDATATGTIRDDGDTAATLAASDIEDATATLTITGHADGWWYMGNAHACTAVAAGTTSVSISGLTTVTDYEYAAYSDSACGTRLARTKFKTLAPEGTPTVSISDAEVSEGGYVTFAVSLSHPSRERVTVEVHTSSGTATSGFDFRAGPQTLTFHANSSRITKYARVEVLDDEEPEPDETFTATLRVPVGATLGDATATGTIRDDGDTAATLTASDIEDTTATLTIGGHTDGWWYRGGNADLCTAVAAGTTAVSISGLMGVTDYEFTAYSDSACGTRLARVKFGTLAPEGTPTVSISDAEAHEDGTWISFKVSLSHPSRKRVFVRTNTSDGTARGTHGDFAPGIDFRHEFPGMGVIFEANSPVTTKSRSVRVFDDQEPEPDETFTVTLTHPKNVTLGDAMATGTIRDDGDTAARLTASDIEDTTATLTISGHTDGWWYKGDEHSCTVVAAGTTAVSIGGLTTVSDYDYTAYSDSTCSTKLARVKFKTIAPEGTPTVSLSDAAASEDGSWIRFKVSLSHPSREPVTVWYETSGGTATSGTDFRADSGTVTLSANSWNFNPPVSVIVHDDQEPEPDETFTVTLTRATGAELGDVTATGTIVDDGDTATTLTPSDIEETTATLTISGHTDAWWYNGNAHACTAVAAGTTAVSIGGLAAVTDYEYTAYSDSTCSTKLANVEFRTLAPEGTPTVSVSDAEVSEDGTRVFFLVSLSHPSREQVTVDVHTSGGTATSGTDFEAVSQTLTFPANSGEPELVPVLVHDDQEPEPDETFTVTLTNPTGATLGDGTATGTIKDNGDTAATAVALVSDPGDDATYAADDTVQVTVTFPKAVAVDTAGGTPRLKLDLDPADGGERWAVYAGGSGTNALTFAYTVATGDVSNGGVAVLADTLELDGGTIRSAAGQADTALGHPGLAADAAHKVDAEPPRLLRGEIDGGTVTLTFSETLDPESTGGRFLMGIQTSETASLGCSAKGAVSVDGETVTFGLGKYCPPARAGLTERNRLTYFRRADGADGSFRDLAGNLLAPDGDAGIGLYVQIDLVNVTGTGSSVTGSSVTGVAVVSDPGDDDTYGLGETIRVRLTFGEAVTVDTAGGTPRMKIRMNLTWGEKWAAYEGGSGTNALTFVYTVRPVNATPHGVAVLANTLELDGGAIASAATGTAANLAHAGLGHDPEHKVDYRLSPPAADAAPAVAGVAVVSDPGDDDTYGAGEAIRVRLTFGEAVTVDTAGGTPRMKIRMNLTWGEKWAAYEGGSGTNALTFAYTVRPVNATPHGVAVLANTLQLNGGAIASVATGANANLAHAGLGHDSAHKVDWRLSPPGAVGTAANAAPAVTGVAVASDAGADDTYMLGETIRVRLAFGETVNVSGTPRMKIKMDPRWGEKWAAYESGSGTTALTFAWTVVEPNYAPQGIAVLANTLQLNGGTIRSAAGTDAALGHAGLGHDGTHKVDWRPALSVADARANEGAAAVEFEVSLNRTFSGTAHRVTVNYATADGTAKADEDYTATSGSLTFAAGERVKTVRVPILDDAIDEGEETFTLRLSNARGARIGDGEATGTIANADPLQKMWLSRFGRTVASHVTDAVSDRLANPLTGAQVTVGGQSVDLAATEDGAALTQALTAVARAFGASEAPARADAFGSGPAVPASGPGAQAGSGAWPGTGLRDAPAPGGTSTRDLSGRELLLGSAFHLAREGDGTGPDLAAWGRVTVSGFDGEERADDGRLRLDGDVTTGILGADAEWDRLLAGVAVSLSEGEGTFAQPGVDSGTIESTMTTVSPYARYALNDRLSVWGLAGWGTGDMTIVQAANDNGQPERVTRTDLEMRLAAVGGRGALLQADEAGGFDLALKADAFYVETEAEAVSNEGSTTGVASRVRLALEGSRAFEMDGGGVLTPGMEIGLRHDGGDAETGTGVELGGRLTWADPDSGLSAEARARTLIAHEDSDYREWGASGSVRLDPGERGRGLSLSLSPTWGAASGGVDRLWSARDARGLAPGREFDAEQRLEGELGYGLGLLGDRFTGTPNLGFGLSDTARDYRVGWRLNSAVRGDPGFEVNLDATRREAANGNEPAEHGVMLRGAIRW